MSTFTGIDNGLDYTDFAKDNECYAGKTTVFCYNEDRNDTYNERAKKDVPLTGDTAKLAKTQFVQYILQYGHEGIKSAGVALKFQDFLEYWLGKTDAALIATYLATGKKWRERGFADFDVTEMMCGQVEIDLGIYANSPDRYVEDAIDHARVVFKNIPSIITYIGTQGDWKQTGVQVAANQKERSDQIAAVKTVVGGLKKALALPGKTAEAAGLLPYVIGGFILFQLLRMGKK